jgi:membrane protein DedA with SNARE-associated domain
MKGVSRVKCRRRRFQKLASCLMFIGLFAEQICGTLIVIFATLLSVCLYILTGEMAKQYSLNITLTILLMPIGIFA